MKPIFSTIVFLSLFSISPGFAADDDKPVSSVEERLARADLSVTLRQYKKVQQLAADAKLELALLALV